MDVCPCQYEKQKTEEANYLHIDLSSNIIGKSKEKKEIKRESFNQNLNIRDYTNNIGNIILKEIVNSNKSLNKEDSKNSKKNINVKRVKKDNSNHNNIKRNESQNSKNSNHSDHILTK